MLTVSTGGVALRKESVDRNQAADMSARRGASVALRKESVDRNKHPEPARQAQGLVALRKESVDRNEKFEGVITIKE